jgi:ureidoacrylate peracid hydrolase
LKPGAEDVVVTKHRYSGFIGTNLDLILRSRQITSLALTGVATNVCVDCTLRDGLQLDYHAALVSDASSATSEKDWRDALKSTADQYGVVCTTAELIARWQASA